MKRKAGRPSKSSLYTVGEAATFVGCSKDTINNWIAKGILPVTRTRAGGWKRIRRADLETLKKHWEDNAMHLVHSKHRRDAKAARGMPPLESLPAAPPGITCTVRRLAKSMRLAEEHLRRLIRESDVLHLYRDAGRKECLMQNDVCIFAMKNGDTVRCQMNYSNENGEMQEDGEFDLLHDDYEDVFGNYNDCTVVEEDWWYVTLA